MKRNRNPTNKYVMKRYATLDSSIGSRSLFVRFSFVLRSVLVHPSFILRSSFVYPSFGLRSGIEEQSKMDRRWIEDGLEAHLRQNVGKTEMHRNSNGKP